MPCATTVGAGRADRRWFVHRGGFGCLSQPKCRSSARRFSACRCVRRSSHRRCRRTAAAPASRACGWPDKCSLSTSTSSSMSRMVSAPSRRISRSTLRNGLLDRGQPLWPSRLWRCIAGRKKRRSLTAHRQRVGPESNTLCRRSGPAEDRRVVSGIRFQRTRLVAALNHVDGVDLHIAEMFDRVAVACDPSPNGGRGYVEPAGRAARSAGLGLPGGGINIAGHRAGNVAGIRARARSRWRGALAQSAGGAWPICCSRLGAADDSIRIGSG